MTDSGVPVAVISNEPLGLALSPSPLQLLTDIPATVYEVYLTALSPKYIYLGNSAVSKSKLMNETGLRERQLRKYVKLLIDLGLLNRRAARGTITLASEITQWAASEL